jgi:hypothetical protein
MKKVPPELDKLGKIARIVLAYHPKKKAKKKSAKKSKENSEK